MGVSPRFPWPLLPVARGSLDAPKRWSSSQPSTFSRFSFRSPSRPAGPPSGIERKMPLCSSLGRFRRPSTPFRVNRNGDACDPQFRARTPLKGRFEQHSGRRAQSGAACSDVIDQDDKRGHSRSRPPGGDPEDASNVRGPPARGHLELTRSVPPLQERGRPDSRRTRGRSSELPGVVNPALDLVRPTGRDRDKPSVTLEAGEAQQPSPEVATQHACRGPVATKLAVGDQLREHPVVLAETRRAGPGHANRPTRCAPLCICFTRSHTPRTPRARGFGWLEYPSGLDESLAGRRSVQAEPVVFKTVPPSRPRRRSRVGGSWGWRRLVVRWFAR